ncbi:MAG: CBS domain-containing protein [Syntrophales bacterium]|nr:CBS domain-containing protein [Syntrophales bacterium]
MKAKDLMVPIQDYLKPETTLREAVNLLRMARRGEEKLGVKGLPVLDGDGKVVGVLAIRDVFKAVYPSYMSMMDLSGFSWEGMVESIAKRVGNDRVETHMNRNVVTIGEDKPLMECLGHIITHNVARLVVLDKTGKVAGMLYERDLFFAIVKAMLDENNGGGK